jgi:Flp pilus assembly protein TadD
VSREATARARALLDVGRADEAAAVLSTTLAADPRDPHAWCLLGLAHLRCDRSRDALASAHRAIELGSELEWAHRIASIAELRLGNRSRAVAAARESVRLGPGIAFSHAQLAIALSRGWPWQWREAATEVDRSLELGSHEPEVHRLAGDVALRLRRRRLAQARYRRALELDPSDATALNNLAVVRLRRGAFVAAATAFSHAAALDPATDLHRRNLDAAVKGTLAHGVVVLGAAIVVASQNRTAGMAIVCVTALIGLICVLRARRTLGPMGWDYVRRVPFTDGAAGAAAVIVALEASMVVACCLAGLSPPPALLLMCLVLSARTFVQLAYRRIAG